MKKIRERRRKKEEGKEGEKEKKKEEGKEGGGRGGGKRGRKEGRMSKKKQKNKNHKVFHTSNVSNIGKICGVLGFWIMNKQLKIKKKIFPSIQMLMSRSSNNLLHF